MNEIEKLLGNASLATEMDEFVAKLARGTPLRVKYGIDPTSPYVHFGHTVPLRVLKRFQDAGHETHLIIGDFTARIGDPSGRDKSRPFLTSEQINTNMIGYIDQIAKFIDTKKIKVWHNSTWLWQMNLNDLVEEFSNITVQQILSRKDFSNRLKEQTPVYLHELIYPVVQGIDSRWLKADVEIGGTEQLYTLLLARETQSKAGQEPQSCITVPILRGTDGKKRMGKSLGNFIGISEDPLEIFGKTMSIPDELLDEWVELLTEPNAISDRSNPYLCKLSLAENLVSQCHDQETGLTTRKQWLERFSKRIDPEDIPEIKISVDEINICNLLVALGLCHGTSEARRLITPISSVTIGKDRIKVVDPNLKIVPADGMVVRVGKRRIVKVRV